MLEIINTETGEVVSTLSEGDRIVRANTRKYLESTTKIPKYELFTKVYRDTMATLADERLTGAEMLMFMHLVINLRYASNVAAYENGKFINRQNMENDLTLSEKTIKRSVSSLKQKCMIVECDTSQGKCFIVNPFLCNVGDRINNTVITLFKKSKWYKEWSTK